MVENVKPDQAANTEQKARQGSGPAGFPFFDYADSFQVAELINSRGGGIADLDQLAAWLNYKSASSGTLASKLASARYFGFIGNTERGRVAITDRARMILAPVVPEDALNAKADAFLGVPLFRRVFDQFRGTALPPDVGLRNLFQHKHQVPPERVQHALRVFKDSARQTGFFDAAADRLIRPGVAGSSAASQSASHPPSQRETEETQAGIHAAIVALLRELPQPGQPWTQQDQQGFLEAFTAMVKFIYPARGE